LCGNPVIKDVVGIVIALGIEEFQSLCRRSTDLLFLGQFLFFTSLVTKGKEEIEVSFPCRTFQ
jgi:hypothetical protein